MNPPPPTTRLDQALRQVDQALQRLREAFLTLGRAALTAARAVREFLKRASKTPHPPRSFRLARQARRERRRALRRCIPAHRR